MDSQARTGTAGEVMAWAVEQYGDRSIWREAATGDKLDAAEIDESLEANVAYDGGWQWAPVTMVEGGPSGARVYAGHLLLAEALSDGAGATLLLELLPDEIVGRYVIDATPALYRGNPSYAEAEAIAQAIADGANRHWEFILFEVSRAPLPANDLAYSAPAPSNVSRPPAEDVIALWLAEHRARLIQNARAAALLQHVRGEVTP